jgi:hypothetical protein
VHGGSLAIGKQAVELGAPAGGTAIGGATYLDVAATGGGWFDQHFQVAGGHHPHQHTMCGRGPAGYSRCSFSMIAP